MCRGLSNGWLGECRQACIYVRPIFDSTEFRKSGTPLAPAVHHGCAERDLRLMLEGAIEYRIGELTLQGFEARGQGTQLVLQGELFRVFRVHGPPHQRELLASVKHPAELIPAPNRCDYGRPVHGILDLSDQIGNTYSHLSEVWSCHFEICKRMRHPCSTWSDPVSIPMAYRSMGYGQPCMTPLSLRAYWMYRRLNCH